VEKFLVVLGSRMPPPKLSHFEVILATCSKDGPSTAAAMKDLPFNLLIITVLVRKNLKKSKVQRASGGWKLPSPSESTTIYYKRAHHRPQAPHLCPSYTVVTLGVHEAAHASAAELLQLPLLQ